MYKKSEMMSLLIICIMSFAMVKSLSTSKKPYLSIASWNVNGLRSLMRHDPSAKVLNNLIYDMHDVDILCLQETKLQEIHTVELENVLRSSIGAKVMLSQPNNATLSCNWNIPLFRYITMISLTPPLTPVYIT